MKRTAMLVLALLLAPAAAAQEPGGRSEAAAPPAAAADRLRALLDELRNLDAAAWEKRLAALEKEAAAREREAGEHSARAQELEQQAERARKAAASLRAEMQKLREVRELIAAMAPGAPAGGGGEAPKAATQKATQKAPGADAKDTSRKDDAPGEDRSTQQASSAKAPAAAAMAGKDGEPAAEAAFVTWAQVLPVFEDHCAGCHDPDDQSGGLDLTTLAAARQGGGSGQSIVPGEPGQSRLYRMVAQQERPFMPRDADPLPAELLERIRTWIEHGAAEDEAAARAFVQKRKRERERAARPVDADAGAGPAPLPAELPAVRLARPAQPVPVRALARSPRAALLAMPGHGQVLLLDRGLARLGVLPGAHPTVATVAFAGDGSLLAVGCGEAGRRGRAVVHDVRTGRALGEVGSERDLPLALALHRGDDGRVMVALGGAGRRARVHALADGEVLLEGKHDDFVLGLSFSPDGALLAAADRAGAVVLWELDGGRQGALLRGHEGAVHAVAFDAGGANLATAGADGTVRLWDPREGKERWRQNAHRGQALAVAVGPGGAVASCGSDGRIAVFTAAGRPTAASNPVGEWLYCAAFGAGDGEVVAGDAQGRLHRFEVKGRKLSLAVPLEPEQ